MRRVGGHASAANSLVLYHIYPLPLQLFFFPVILGRYFCGCYEYCVVFVIAAWHYPVWQSRQVYVCGVSRGDVSG